MIVDKILTKRKLSNWPSLDLVNEWEDMLVKQLPACLTFETYTFWDKCINKIPYLRRILTDFLNNTLVFEMNPYLKKDRPFNKKNYVPCIIDYYLKESDLPLFYKAYSAHKLVLISSKEVYDYLLEVQAPLKLVHWPLSISDEYRIKKDILYEKEYDLVLLGRQNPVLSQFLEQYITLHKDFIYVYRKQDNDKFMYYTSDGKCIGNINTRQQYIALMRKAKCGLYATPGIDGDEVRTNGFSQVTPRFLEYIACGCHVIARYKKNSDTDYYELNKFSSSIDSYEQFELALETACSQPVDWNMYSSYLNHHYTSERIKQLKNILKEI